MRAVTTVSPCRARMLTMPGFRPSAASNVLFALCAFSHLSCALGTGERVEVAARHAEVEGGRSRRRGGGRQDRAPGRLSPEPCSASALAWFGRRCSSGLYTAGATHWALFPAQQRDHPQHVSVVAE